MEKLDKLKKLGLDVDNALARLGGMSDLYLGILDKFLEDNSFDLFENFFNQGLYEDALRNIHALKGILYNLGMNEEGDMAQIIVNDLRANNYMERIPKVSKKLKKNYLTYKKKLNKLLK
ncbi:MAG: hypothetical protein MJ113_04930 [Lachnospiraceae bacterium]|nr:hypothetical protein [Lachnospiraceae bacterium]